MDEHTILVMAHEHLEEHGWTKGWGLGSSGPTCLVGALRRVTATSYLGVQQEQQIQQALAVLGFLSTWAATSWNDRQRSRRKVLKRLKKGIKATRPPATRPSEPIEMQPQLASTHEHDLP